MTIPNQIQAIAALDEPIRRRLYEYVAASRDAISRDQAAEAIGIGRPLAAFHLDRLAAEGLFEVEFRRLSGRTGRGAGRPSKLYRRADRDFAVQLPSRSYALAADLMAAAIDTLGTPAIEALDRKAREHGAELGRAASRPNDWSSGGSEIPLDVAAAALAKLGYEPHLDASGDLRLSNCPFHDLAATHRQATCGMNLSMVQGMLGGLEVPGLVARLDPEPGWCCVRITAAETDRPARQSQISTEIPTLGRAVSGNAPPSRD